MFNLVQQPFFAPAHGRLAPNRVLGSVNMNTRTILPVAFVALASLALVPNVAADDDPPAHPGLDSCVTMPGGLVHYVLTCYPWYVDYAMSWVGWAGDVAAWAECHTAGC